MKRKAGRPKEKFKRSKVVHVRVYEDEYKDLCKIAKKAGTQPSKVIRNAISAIIRADRPIIEKRQRNPDEFEAMVNAVRENPPLLQISDGVFETW